METPCFVNTVFNVGSTRATTSFERVLEGTVTARQLMHASIIIKVVRRCISERHYNLVTSGCQSEMGV